MKRTLASWLRSLADWLQRDEIAATLDNLYAESLPDALMRESRESAAIRREIEREHPEARKVTPFARRLRTLR